ncbi:MAG: NYN domain-containing protein, partial [Actinomycetota bacterium]
MADPMTYLLVDGENIDWALGGILGHKPEPHQRPRWGRLVEAAEDEWGLPVRALFFMNATRGMPTSFVQALMAMDFRPVPLSGEADEKVVDIAIQRTMEAIVNRDGHVLLVSHDGDFAEDLSSLASDPDRRVGLMAFEELVSSSLRDIDRLE